MHAKLRRSLRVAVIVGVLLPFIGPAGPGRRAAAHELQADSAPDLRAALRAGDLDKARALVPVSWTAAEQLFVSYLERAFITPDAVRSEPDARTLAGRLADVFFRIVEYDFARSVVSALDTADAGRRQQLIAAVRDYYATLQRWRAAYTRSDSEPFRGPASGITQQVGSQFKEVAERFGTLAFPRGQFWTLRSMIEAGVPMPRPPQPAATATGTAQQAGAPTALQDAANALADRLGDDLSLVWKRPGTESSAAQAERLGLPRRQVAILGDLASAAQAAKPAPRLEDAARYLEQMRLVYRNVPPMETYNSWASLSPAPRLAAFTLSALWNHYHRLNRPADAKPLIAEALAISRPFGERAAASTLAQFAALAATSDAAAEVLEANKALEERGRADVISALARSVVRLDWNAASRFLEASRSLGQKAQLSAARQLGDAAVSSMNAMAERTLAGALALAMDIPDPHEQAVTVEWYGRQALVWLTRARGVAQATGDVARLFTPAYRELRDRCLTSTELELTADALANEGEALARFGGPGMGDETYRQAIDAAGRAGNWLKVAQIANRAVDAPTGRPTPAARAEFTARAVEAARKADSPLELAKALRESAKTVGDMREAVAAAERYTQQSGDPQVELETLTSLALQLRAAGQYQAAIDAHLQVATRLAGLSNPTLDGRRLYTYERVLEIYSTIGEPGLARETADRLRQFLETSVLQANRPRSTSVPDAYRSLGNVAEELGEPFAALEYWDKALSALRDLTLESIAFPRRRGILEARASLNARLGDFEASLKDWDDVLPLIAPTRVNFYGFSDTGHLVAWKTAVAWTHALAGNLDRALALTREAIAELKTDTSGLLAGLWYDNQSAEERLLKILILAKHPEEAVPLYEALLRVPLNPQREKHLRALLARAYAAAGQGDNARALLAKVREIDRRLERPTGEASGPTADVLLALGMLDLETGDNAQATAGLLAARDTVNPYDSERIWQVERALGLALARTGDRSGAVARYENALAALESVHQRPRPEEARLRYGFDPALAYDEYAGLVSAMAVLSGREEDAERAFHAAERKRTQTLRNLLATGWSRMPSAALPDQLRRLREMDARLTAKLEILRAQFDAPPGKVDRALVEKLKAEVKQIQADHARLLASIAQGQYRYAAPTGLAAPRAAAARAALSPPVALVEYLVLDDRSYAFVLTRVGVKLIPLAIGREGLRNQVGSLLLPFRQLRTGNVDLTRLDFDVAASHTLYQAIFAPVQPHVGSASELVIVPDDILNILPFEALVERAPRAAATGGVVHAELADQAFLLRRYAISYLASSAELLSGPAPVGPAGGTPRRFFAMANPTPGRVQPEPAQDDPFKRQLRSAGFDAYFAPLPGADAEVKRAAGSFPAGSSTIVTGARATEAAYRASAGQAIVVHLATHAVASDTQPLYSTLVLAPEAKSGDDGLLQAFEVLRTPLRADLVVLSGCETALGSQDWGQGLVGLLTAFGQAGARSVLATLWSIDESTSDLMADFYRAMAQGRSATEALRQAKLQLLQRRMPLGNVEISLAHPFFWAPFKLMGVASR